jgi:hypothetical protein
MCKSTATIGLCAVPDGDGGAVVVWVDSRGRHESVWARRVDGDGNPRWQADGVLLRGETWSPRSLSACPYPEGGMIACWVESYAGPYAAQVTAQRVDSSGEVRWGSTGVVVTGSDGDRDYSTSIVGDGRGGALVVWLRKQGGSQGWLDSLCVQRLDSLGRPCWGSHGVLVSADTLLWTSPCLCQDGQGGAFVAWPRYQGQAFRTYVQHVDSSGRPAWTAGGVSACSSSAQMVSALGVAESDSGCVVAFAKGVSGSEGIWAQRLSGSGGLLWGSQGARVCASAGLVWDFEILWDEPQGVLCAWSAKRHDTYDVLAQRLDRDGVRMWDTAGVEVGTIGSGEGHGLSVVSGGRGDLIAAWPTLRMGDWDILAQRVDPSGSLAWGDSGLAAVDDTLKQYWEPAIVTDQRQGAIVFWEYSYATPQGYKVGINTQRIGDETAIQCGREDSVHQASVVIWPSPARDRVNIRFRTGSVATGVDVVDIRGAVVRRLREKGGERAAYLWDRKDDAGRPVPAGVFFCRQTVSGRLTGKVILAPE